MSGQERILERVEALLDRIERLLPRDPAAIDWGESVALRWRRAAFGPGWLQPVHARLGTRLADLHCIDGQRDALVTNTRQFLAGLPANNALLWGPRGTGKSSLVKAILAEFASSGLRLVEIDREHLLDLPDVVTPLGQRPERFIVYCDDLSFETGDASYKALKAMIDGSIQRTPDNVIVYATSNRRHLLPERLADNLEARNVDGEIHHAEAVEERISLSERFGLWLSFHPFSQDEYLEIVAHWLRRLGARDSGDPALRTQALAWALAHGSRSGRSAWQFAKDWAGRKALQGHA
ncbi:MAG: ATP-binding protein [Gammaproteobacteria bacterium]